MGLRKLFRVSLCSLICFQLTACEGLVLPSFDGGVLNPDIRFLHTAEVMDGVKCAMVAFMNEREQSLLQQRLDPRNRESFIRVEDLGSKTMTFDPYGLNATKEVANKCPMSDHHFDAKKRQCVPNNCESEAKRPLGVTLWDYKPSSNTKVVNHCVAIPDYSQFALDHTQSASIELTLSATNTGSVSYTKIDANKLDPHHIFVAPGNGQTGAPFPGFSTTSKDVTTFDLTAVMPQSLHGYEQGQLPIDAAFPLIPPPYLGYARPVPQSELSTVGVQEISRPRILEEKRAQPSKDEQAKVSLENLKAANEDAINLDKKSTPPKTQAVIKYIKQNFEKLKNLESMAPESKDREELTQALINLAGEINKDKKFLELEVRRYDAIKNIDPYINGDSSLKSKVDGIKPTDTGFYYED